MATTAPIWLRAAGIYTLAALLQACSASKASCVPGQQQTCSCLGGQPGFQACLPSGGAFSVCSCQQAPDGSTDTAPTDGGPDSLSGTDEGPGATDGAMETTFTGGGSDSRPEVDAGLDATDGPTETTSMDGGPDLAGIDASPDTHPLCGDGVVAAGEFCLSLSTPLPASANALSLTIGDFNEDGLPDVAVATVPAGVVVLIATVPGRFGNGGNTIGMADAVVVRSADFDGDGHLDIAVARQTATNSVTFLWGAGDGTFPTQTSVPNPYTMSVSYIAVGDIDGDGTPDVVASSSQTGSPPVLLLLNGGQRTFATRETAPLPAGSQGGPIALGDFDGDGSLDIATGLVLTSTQSAATSVFLNDGFAGYSGPLVTTAIPCAGQKQVPNCFVDGIAAGNLNNDAYQDLVVAMAGPIEVGISVELSSGRGIFALPDIYDVGKQLGFPTLADVNGDGQIDIVVPATQSDSVSVLLGDINGHFSALPPISVSPLGRVPIEIAVADINLDGEPDIAVVNDLTGNVSLLLSQP